MRSVFCIGKFFFSYMFRFMPCMFAMLLFFLNIFPPFLNLFLRLFAGQCANLIDISKAFYGLYVLDDGINRRLFYL